MSEPGPFFIFLQCEISYDLRFPVLLLCGQAAAMRKFFEAHQLGLSSSSTGPHFIATRDAAIDGRDQLGRRNGYKRHIDDI